MIPLELFLTSKEIIPLKEIDEERKITVSIEPQDLGVFNLPYFNQVPIANTMILSPTMQAFVDGKGHLSIDSACYLTQSRCNLCGNQLDNRLSSLCDTCSAGRLRV